MAGDARNVLAVNCKGGKGRTGTFLTAYLLRCGHFATAEEALQFFAERRTDLEVGAMFQGVETPSQARYVQYVERVLHAAAIGSGDAASPPVFQHISTSATTLSPAPTSPAASASFLTPLLATAAPAPVVGGRPLAALQVSAEKRTLAMVRIRGLAPLQGLVLEILEGTRLVFDLATQQTVGGATVTHRQGGITEIDVGQVTVSGDVKVRLDAQGLPKGYDDCALFFWFHTNFIDGARLALARHELDNPHKSKTWRVFTSGLAVELYFSDGGAVSRHSSMERWDC
jgi:PTEN phosphatase family protein